ncbi:MAG: hypothetical protein C0432_02945 [Candidatus Puniceispirillum sp.]|nr:hypothetical protein [Candidatus Pelagibacter sp.]MBA4283233.1 hypothetical protein [Candidatus Puniceispirillum sp.]
MSKSQLTNKIKALSHLSRVEKMKMNEWMVQKAEIVQKISTIDFNIQEIEKKMNDEGQPSRETMLYLEIYSKYMAQKKEQLCIEKKNLVLELDKAQENLILYFTQHKTHENLQQYTFDVLDLTIQKEQRETLDDIAMLGHSRKQKRLDY